MSQSVMRACIERVNKLVAGLVQEKALWRKCGRARYGRGPTGVHGRH
jgi:hypothetical protein